MVRKSLSWLKSAWVLTVESVRDARDDGPINDLHETVILGGSSIAALCLVMAVVCVTFPPENPHSHIVGASLGAAAAFAVISGLAFLLPSLIGRICLQKAATASAQTACLDHHPDTLRLNISELEVELLGNGSRYAAILARVDGQNGEARALRDRLDLRLRENAADFLRKARDDVDRVVARSGETQEQLAVYHAKVTAFLAECRDTVSRIEPSLRDLELVREVGRLSMAAPDLEREANAVIEDGITQLRARMTGVRAEVETRFGERQIPLSELFAYNPEPAREHDGFRALAELESRIETFDPGLLRDIA